MLNALLQKIKYSSKQHDWWDHFSNVVATVDDRPQTPQRDLQYIKWKANSVSLPHTINTLISQWWCQCYSLAVMGECAVHYSAILSRNPSTSSRMFREKNLGNSVDDGVRDNGGMCRKAFLQEERTQKNNSEWTNHYTWLSAWPTETSYWLLPKMFFGGGAWVACLTVYCEGQCEPVQGWSPWMQWPKRWGETGTRWLKHPKQTPLYSW